MLLVLSFSMVYLIESVIADDGCGWDGMGWDADVDPVESKVLPVI